MSESESHKTLKPIAARFLRDELGCGVILTEPVIAKRWTLNVRPDVLGVVTDHPDSKRLWASHDVEVEPSLAGIAAEYRKDHRRSPFGSLCEYQWLLYPDSIDPDLETLRVPVWVGLLTVDADEVVTMQREAKWQGADPRRIVALLATQIIHYQRETGKAPDRVRPAAKALARLDDGQYVKLVKFLERNPDAALKEAAHELEMDLKDFRRCAKSGIAGVEYDFKGRLHLQGTEQKASA